MALPAIEVGMFAVERERPLSCLDKWQPRADT
jgi:hypothetical protein